MDCSECGFVLEDKFHYCPGCGKKIMICLKCASQWEGASLHCRKCGEGRDKRGSGINDKVWREFCEDRKEAVPLQAVCPKCKIRNTGLNCRGCGKKNCSVCLAQLEDFFLYCPVCGDEVDKKSPGIDDKELRDFLEKGTNTLEIVNCSGCLSQIEDTFLFCPNCGKEVDKSGGIDDKELQDYLDNRKKTLDVLERVIRKLETCGKVAIGSNLVSNGANIVSGIMGLIVPTKPVAVIVGVIASILGIANEGGSLLTSIIENGLLIEADVACKLDYTFMLRAKTLLPLIVKIYRFQMKFKELNEMCKSGNLKDCSFRPTQKEATVSMLANFREFLANANSLYQGNYSLVAGSIKEQRDTLLAEYEEMKKYKRQV